MDRSEFNAHEGLRAGRRTPEYMMAREAFRLAQARAGRLHRLKVRALYALLAANAVVWTVQHLRGAL